MDTDFLKEMGFSDDQISKVTEPEYKVIRNFFNPQEISNIDKDQILTAAKILAPVFQNLKIVDMLDYIGEKKSSGESLESNQEDFKVQAAPTTIESDPAQDKVLESLNTKKDTTYNFEQYINDKYIVYQVWILEHLVNNPNLLTMNDSIEKVKTLLRYKEIELKIHNLIMQKFFESVRTIGNIYTVLNFKHFDSIKKDMAVRLNEFQKNPPLNFRGVVDILQKVGFEDQRELNKGICSILSELVKDPKLQKLIKYTEENFKEVDLGAEKKKLLRKIFKK